VPKDDWRRVGVFFTLNTRPGDTLGAPDVQAFHRFYAPHQQAVIADATTGAAQGGLAKRRALLVRVSSYTLDPMGETQTGPSRCRE